MARRGCPIRKAEQFKVMSQKMNQKFMSTFGVSNSAMRNRLRAKIIYSFFVMRDGDKCFRCGEPVDQKDYSIDHGESFWDADDPLESFYNVSKCFLSHFTCNTKHGTQEARKRKERVDRKRKQLKDAFLGGDTNE